MRGYSHGDNIRHVHHHHHILLGRGPGDGEHLGQSACCLEVSEYMGLNFTAKPYLLKYAIAVSKQCRPAGDRARALLVVCTHFCPPKLSVT